MTTISEKLLARADEYQQKATALRVAAAELHDVRTATKQTQLAGALAGAIEIRAKRPTASNGHRRGGTKLSEAEMEARREVILKALRRGPQKMTALTQALHDAGYKVQRDRARQFVNANVPEARCVGFTTSARWILKNGNGKSTRAAAKKKRTSSSNTAVRARRERSAAWLATFNTATPSSAPKGMKPATIGVYVRRGYLKRKNGGYVRTAKPFSVALP